MPKPVLEITQAQRDEVLAWVESPEGQKTLQKAFEKAGAATLAHQERQREHTFRRMRNGDFDRPFTI